MSQYPSREPDPRAIPPAPGDQAGPGIPPGEGGAEGVAQDDAQRAADEARPADRGARDPPWVGPALHRAPLHVRRRIDRPRSLRSSPRGRIPEDKHGQLVEDVFLPPDLAIEILSPGQTVSDLDGEALALRAQRRPTGLAHPTETPPSVRLPPRSAHRDPGEPGRSRGRGVLPGFTLPLSELFGWLVRR